MSEKRIRVGVIGTGYVAKNNFLPVLPRFEDVDFVGVMSRDIANAKKAQKMCGAWNATDSIQELVDMNLDCVFVLTPKQCHAEQISFLLNHGLDVYSENQWQLL